MRRMLEIDTSGSEGSGEETTGRSAGIGASPMTLPCPTFAESPRTNRSANRAAVAGTAEPTKGLSAFLATEMVRKLGSTESPGFWLLRLLALSLGAAFRFDTLRN